MSLRYKAELFAIKLSDTDIEHRAYKLMSNKLRALVTRPPSRLVLARLVPELGSTQSCYQVISVSFYELFMVL